jgi:hypothetical protein
MNVSNLLTDMLHYTRVPVCLSLASSQFVFFNNAITTLGNRFFGRSNIWGMGIERISPRRGISQGIEGNFRCFVCGDPNLHPHGNVRMSNQALGEM